MTKIFKKFEAAHKKPVYHAPPPPPRPAPRPVPPPQVPRPAPSVPLFPEGSAVDELSNRVQTGKARLEARLRAYDQLQNVLNDPKFRSSLAELKRIQGNAELVLGDRQLGNAAASAFETTDQEAQEIKSLVTEERPASKRDTSVRTSTPRVFKPVVP